MAGKTPKEAADNFVRFLRESLSCLSDHFVTAFQQSPKLYKVYYEPYAKVCDYEYTDSHAEYKEILGKNKRNFEKSATWKIEHG